MVVRPCCQCNDSNAKCLHCSCVRSKTPYSSCHPSRSGRCCNIPSTHVPSNQAPSSTVTLSAMCSHVSPDPVSPSPNQEPGNGPLPLSSFSLPSLLSIFVFTLQHVSKGACDTWSGQVTTELNSILSFPSDINSWCKFMMLAKCILVNPSGRYFSWKDTLRIVKD